MSPPPYNDKAEIKIIKNSPFHLGISLNSTIPKSPTKIKRNRIFQSSWHLLQTQGSTLVFILYPIIPDSETAYKHSFSNKSLWNSASRTSENPVRSICARHTTQQIPAKRMKIDVGMNSNNKPLPSSELPKESLECQVYRRGGWNFGNVLLCDLRVLIDLLLLFRYHCLNAKSKGCVLFGESSLALVPYFYLSCMFSSTIFLSVESPLSYVMKIFEKALKNGRARRCFSCLLRHPLIHLPCFHQDFPLSVHGMESSVALLLAELVPGLECAFWVARKKVCCKQFCGFRSDKFRWYFIRIRLEIAEIFRMCFAWN